MDYFEQIEAYKLNTLSEPDRLAFEQAMEADPTLAQAVADYHVAMDVVGSILEGEIRTIIENEALKSENLEGAREEEGQKGIDDLGDQEEKMGAKDTKVRRMNWVRWAVSHCQSCGC